MNQNFRRTTYKRQEIKKKVTVLSLLVMCTFLTAADKNRTFENLLNAERADVVLLGTVQSILTPDGLATTDTSLTNRDARLELWNKCRVSNQIAVDKKKVEGCSFRVKVHKIFKGNIKEGIVSVFCCHTSNYLLVGETGFFFLSNVQFTNGENLTPVDAYQRTWNTPSSLTTSNQLEGIRTGIDGMQSYLKLIITSADDDFASQTAMDSLRITDNSILPAIRNKLTEYMAKKDGNDDQIIATYIVSLLLRRDTKSLTTYTDWLVQHPQAVRSLRFVTYGLPFIKTPFDQENQQIASHLERLAIADLGRLQQAAKVTLEWLNQGDRPLDPDNVEEAELIKKQAQQEKTLKRIYAAKIAWLTATQNTTTNPPTQKDLTPFMESTFPTPSTDGWYEIGAMDEFPHYWNFFKWQGL